MAGDAAAARIGVASRTDAGVSARANALCLRSPLVGPALLRALNGISPEILFLRAAAVTEDFRVRTPIDRTYRYLLLSQFHDRKLWEETARLFVGDVDARTFGRGGEPAAPVSRRLESVEVLEAPDGFWLELRAKSFAWGMVRKIVGSLELVEVGELDPDRLHEAIRGSTRLSLPLADPGPLVLWEVRYDRPWEFVSAGLTRHQSKYFSEELRRGRARQQILSSLTAGLG